MSISGSKKAINEALRLDVWDRHSHPFKAGFGNHPEASALCFGI
jgi:hypothetical protein